jgi:hypothetical protein
MTNINILFYSNKCKFSKQIIHLINEIDDINSFKLICIDENINKFPYIHRVPTLLISEYKKPIVGINAFNWINSKNQFNKNTNNINLNPNSNLNPKYNILLNDNNEKLKGNSKITLDDYSFINDINTSKIENFFDQKIYTLPEAEKINQLNQKKKLNKLMNLRSKQDSLLYNDIETRMSSHNKIILEKDMFSSLSSKNNDINKRMNDLNFSVSLRNDIKNTPNIELYGKSTSHIKENKKQYKE